MSTPDAILQFWFHDLTDATPINKNKPPASSWFTKSRRFDEEILQRFEPDWQKGKAGELKEWEATARGRLALVILFDQFPRNMFRNSPQAFATDLLALDLARRSVKEGTDKELALIERVFLYMPFMHAEAISIQEEGVRVFEAFVEESKRKASPNTAYFEYNLLYAKRHREIIAKFGRFPHRNAVLARSVTPPEAEFEQTRLFLLSAHFENKLPFCRICVILEQLIDPTVSHIRPFPVESISRILNQNRAAPEGRKRIGVAKTIGVVDPS